MFRQDECCWYRFRLSKLRNSCRWTRRCWCYIKWWIQSFESVSFFLHNNAVGSLPFFNAFSRNVSWLMVSHAFVTFCFNAVFIIYFGHYIWRLSLFEIFFSRIWLRKIDISFTGIKQISFIFWVPKVTCRFRWMP